MRLGPQAIRCKALYHNIATTEGGLCLSRSGSSSVVHAYDTTNTEKYDKGTASGPTVGLQASETTDKQAEEKKTGTCYLLIVKD